LAATVREAPLFVCPLKRYNYWTPKAMRVGDKVLAHSSALGTRTSPFLSFWYIPFTPHHNTMCALIIYLAPFLIFWCVGPVNLHAPCLGSGTRTPPPPLAGPSSQPTWPARTRRRRQQQQLRRWRRLRAGARRGARAGAKARALGKESRAPRRSCAPPSRICPQRPSPPEGSGHAGCHRIHHTPTFVCVRPSPFPVLRKGPLLAPRPSRKDKQQNWVRGFV
jgi:hypothetical protein